MKIFKSLSFLSFFMYLLIQQGFSIIIIGFDTFEFNENKQKISGIRAVKFNTDTQKFEEISYFESADFLNYKIGEKKITCDEKANLTLEKGFILGDLGIWTTGTINHPYKKAELINGKRSNNQGYQFLVKNKINIKPAEAIQLLLNRNFGCVKTGQKFKAQRLKANKSKEECLFSMISKNKDSNNKERGKLGELATDFTLLSFGYNKFYPTKYGCDHGFDSVVEDGSTTPELFLTESKCREESKTPQSYMEESLSEGAIVKQLDCMKNKGVKQTKDRILDYINTAPDKIFKFVHRILPNGQAQCYIEKFNPRKYHLQRALYHKDSDKIEGKNNILESLLVMLYPKLDKEKINNILNLANN